MSTPSTESATPRDFTLALAGAAAAGAAAALPDGIAASARMAAGLPGVFFCVALVMLPALYVALALTDNAPPLPALVARAAQSLRDAGVLLLGTAPALLFFGATDGHDPWQLAAGRHREVCVVAIAALLCLGALGRRVLGATASFASKTVFLLWAVVAAGVGLRLVYGLLSA